MSELFLQTSENLANAMVDLPEEIRTEFEKMWTQQAIGARIVAEMATNQPG